MQRTNGSNPAEKYKREPFGWRQGEDPGCESSNHGGWLSSSTTFSQGVKIRTVGRKIGSLFRETRHCPLNCPRDSEVAQLKVPILGNKDIFRLDVSVDGVITLA